MQLWIGDGRLTRDPELRYTQTGVAIAKFAIACEGDSWRDKDDNLIRDTQFIECEVWAKQAESLCKHFTKGDPILLQGAFRTDKWEDKTTGENRYRSYIRVAKWNFTLSKGKGQPKQEDDTPEESEDTQEFKPAPKAKSKPKSAPKKTRPPADDLDELDLDSEVL